MQGPALPRGEDVRRLLGTPTSSANYLSAGSP
jgi:hypothetical protein